MIPVIALVGRPNVGKSTLFNRLTRSRDALVADFPGLTRDRQYGEGVFEGQRFGVIDTGGISGEEAGVDAAMAAQSWQAVLEADGVCLLVDARAGLTAVDEQIVQRLRAAGKAFYLVVNKIDGLNPDEVLGEFYRLGVATVYPVTATHGRGVRTLMTAVLADLSAAATGAEAPPDAGIKVGVVGRPNVGKSTLVNRLLGEERVVVFDQPGTTRDSVYIRYERDGQVYTLIDTAGVRRRKNVREAVEKFSIVKTLQAIQDAHVVVVVMNAREGLVEQDLHLIGQVIDSGRALVLAMNQWDGLAPDDRRAVRREMDRRLRFLDYAEPHFISALHGTGVGHLYAAVRSAFQSAETSLSTHRLTRILEDATATHPPPAIQGRRIKLRYAHQGGTHPPVVVIHGNQTDKVPAHYRRYLENTFRRAMGLQGTPLRLVLRSGENPYAGRRNALSPRQRQRRKRLMKFVKRKR